MKLNLAEIKRVVGSSAEFDLKKSTMNVNLKKEGVNTVGPVRVKGKMENLGNRVFQIKGRIEVVAIGVCSRCLKQTNVKQTIVFSLKFSDAREKSKEGDLITFSGDEINLNPQIADEIILNWPGKILCKPNCKGLCSKCGKDMNTTICKCENDDFDPRFSALKQLFQNK